MNEPQAVPARKRGGRRRSAGREAAPTQTANWPDYKTPPTVSMGPVNILSDNLYIKTLFKLCNPFMLSVSPLILLFQPWLKIF